MKRSGVPEYRARLTQLAAYIYEFEPGTRYQLLSKRADLREPEGTSHANPRTVIGSAMLWPSVANGSE